jgi:hypothetical protein
MGDAPAGNASAILRTDNILARKWPIFSIFIIIFQPKSVFPNPRPYSRLRIDRRTRYAKKKVKGKPISSPTTIIDTIFNIPM